MKTKNKTKLDETFWPLTSEDVLLINSDISHSIGHDIQRWEADHIASFLNRIIKNRIQKEQK